VATSTRRASLETLEDRLAPALLSLLSPPEHGLALGQPLSAVRLELSPSLGANVELKTSLLSLDLKTNLNVSVSESVSEISLGRGLQLSITTFIISEPLLTLNTDASLVSDVRSSGGGVGVGVGAGGQTPGGTGTVGVGGTVGIGGSGLVINPTPAPVQQPASAPTQHAATPALQVFVSLPAIQTVNTNAATAVALSVTANTSANLIGRAQPAFLSQTVPTGAADALLVQATLARTDVSRQPLSVGRLPKPDVSFAEGGADDPDRLDQPDFELPVVPPLKIAPNMGVDPALLELGLAGAAPEVAFVPGLSGDDNGEGEPAPLLAGLGGEGNLSSWLLFALAVSGLAVARLAAPQPRRRSEQDSLVLRDESSLI
jgi:hypothetical protein